MPASFISSDSRVSGDEPGPNNPDVTSYLEISGLDSDNDNSQSSPICESAAAIPVSALTIHACTANTRRPPMARWAGGSPVGADKEGSVEMGTGVREINGNDDNGMLDQHHEFIGGNNQCDVFQHWSSHSGGAHLALA